jgi:hypothetical protein
MVAALVDVGVFLLPEGATSRDDDRRPRTVGGVRR